MAEIERVKNCVQCRAEFRERSNYGRLMCRLHPDYTPIDSFRRIKCCGYRPGDDTATYSKTVTHTDRRGCLPCDHSADAPITQSPVVIMACLLIESRLVLEPMVDQIVDRIDGEILRKRIRSGGPNVKLSVAMPDPLTWAELDIVACAFHVLDEFVQSPYYEWSQYNGVQEARTRFEAASKKLVVCTGWDTELDLRPDYDPFVTNADTGDGDGKGLSDDTYVPADRLRLDSPETRHAIVQKVYHCKDFNLLCDMAVPFYVIRRVAAAKDAMTLEHFSTYNKAEARTWNSAMRNTRFSNTNEYLPETLNANDM